MNSMTQFLKISYLVALVTFYCLKGYNQEVIGLTENKVIKEYLKSHETRMKSTANQHPVTLPFIDDFSTSKVLPDENLWEDNYAFINSDYPIEPISIGVATLDAIDNTGNVYAIDNNVTPSDTLTSRQIDLFEFKDSGVPVTLSFWYQAGGKGEPPEEKDSLLLEFFSPKDTCWTRSAWKAEQWPIDTFMQEIISVHDSLFQNGFKFRFRNYTSMSEQSFKQGKGALSNVDQWHLDYVLLDNRPVEEHTKINDIAFIEKLRSTLRYYESVPWSHLDNVITDERLDTIPIYIRNTYERLNSPDDSTTVIRQYYIKDLNSNEYFKEPYPVNGITEQFLNNSIIDRGDRFKPYYSQTEEDFGWFEVAAYFRDTKHFKGNDTVKRIEKFLDYYAYDDGTAEFGFGISGESSAGSLLANRFKLYKSDTLRALDFYFNKTRDNYNATKSFKICIWEDNNGIPGELIYPEDIEESPFLYPDSLKGLNEFTRYSLDTFLVVSGTIYVGWQQTTVEFLNLGYDINNANKKNILSNLSGEWVPFSNSPSPEGSLMIRLVFGTNPIITALKNNYRFNKDLLTIYPNPANDYISIRYPPAFDDYPLTINIFDPLGRIVYSSDKTVSEIILSDLKPGMYILRISGIEGAAMIRKLIISR